MAGGWLAGSVVGSLNRNVMKKDDDETTDLVNKVNK